MHPSVDPVDVAPGASPWPGDTEGQPVQVRVVSPHPVIRAGVRALLGPYPTIAIRTDDRADIHPRARAGDGADVVIYDVFGLHLDGGDGLKHELRAHAGRVLALGRILQPGLTARALDLGAVASISIGAEGEEFAAAIHAAAAGHLADGSVHDLANRVVRQRHLGRDRGLTTREQQILALIVAGAANDLIADQLFLSINTVKTLIRSAYKKVGVTTRAQAVAWGVEHGFPSTTLVATPAEECAGETGSAGQTSPPPRSRRRSVGG